MSTWLYLFFSVERGGGCQFVIDNVYGQVYNKGLPSIRGWVSSEITHKRGTKSAKSHPRYGSMAARSGVKYDGVDSQFDPALRVVTDYR